MGHATSPLECTPCNISDCSLEYAENTSPTYIQRRHLLSPGQTIYGRSSKSYEVFMSQSFFPIYFPFLRQLCLFISFPLSLFFFSLSPPRHFHYPLFFCFSFNPIRNLSFHHGLSHFLITSHCPFISPFLS